MARHYLRVGLGNVSLGRRILNLSLYACEPIARAREVARQRHSDLVIKYKDDTVAEPDRNGHIRFSSQRKMRSSHDLTPSSACAYRFVAA